MRAILTRSVALIMIVEWCCWAEAASSKQNLIIIRPEDFAQVDVNARTVNVLITGLKAKQLANKDRHTTIEFSVPFDQAKEVLIGATRFGSNWATISFTFPSEDSARNFAALLKAAKVKILSQCDCH